jgi:hypothetical protein
MYNWIVLNKEFRKKLRSAKSNFYSKKVKDLKDSDPSQWYSKLKRLCSYDQQKSAVLICEEISELSDQQQADVLADKFSGISNEYEGIKKDELNIPPDQMGHLPQFTPLQVLEHILKLKPSKSTVQSSHNSETCRIYLCSTNTCVKHLYPEGRISQYLED